MARGFGKGFSKFDKEIGQKVVELGHQCMAVHYYLKMCAAFHASQYCEIDEVWITIKEIKDALKIAHRSVKSCLNALSDGKIIEFKDFGRGWHTGFQVKLLESEVPKGQPDVPKGQPDVPKGQPDVPKGQPGCPVGTHTKIEDIKKRITNTHVVHENGEATTKEEDPLLRTLVYVPSPLENKKKTRAKQRMASIKPEILSELLKIYKDSYPRKTGPDAGFEVLAQQNFDEVKLAEFKRAVENYAIERKDYQKKHIKMFSGFCQENYWRGYIDYQDESPEGALEKLEKEFLAEMEEINRKKRIQFGLKV